jgi:hypothetical protein
LDFDASGVFFLPYPAFHLLDILANNISIFSRYIKFVQGRYIYVISSERAGY